MTVGGMSYESSERGIGTAWKGSLCLTKRAMMLKGARGHTKSRDRKDGGIEGIPRGSNVTDTDV